MSLNKDKKQENEKLNLLDMVGATVGEGGSATNIKLVSEGVNDKDDSVSVVDLRSAEYDLSKLSSEEQRKVMDVVRALNEHFIRHGNADFSYNANQNADPDEAINAEEFEAVKGRLMEKVNNYLVSHKAPEYLWPYIRRQFEVRRWGYDRIEPLLGDIDISDIKIYDYDDIRIKKLGKRYKTNISFSSREDYKEFVSMCLTRNGVGQSDQNAIVKFTDVLSNPLFRLRFDVMTKYVTSVGRPYVHCRLVPKQKRSLAQLGEMGFFPNETREYIESHLLSGDGMLVTGKNGSGKTTLVNGAIDLFPEQRSIMVIEDNQELFSDVRGEIYFTHSVESRASNKITYGMTDLAEEGLLSDIDIMVVGEVKNDSAKGIMKAAYVGVQPITTSHGQSAVDGYYKLADYVKQATTYELSDCLRFLIGFKMLIFMQDFKVAQIVRTVGFNSKKGEPIFETVYDALNPELSATGGWVVKNNEGGV